MAPEAPALRHNSPSEPTTLGDLVTTSSDHPLWRARAGDEKAWQELVRQYTPLVWKVARSFRLGTADAADAVQNTWVALAEHLPRLRRPERLAAWLTTTARRESLRILLRGRREVPVAEVDDTEGAGPEPQVLRADRERLMWAAFAELPVRCRQLLGLLAFAPDLTYAQVSRAVGLEVGSVSKTRGRCLDELRRRLVARGEDPDDLH
jgi:RNA polymerase sigma factor (sigma-70 family)